MRAVQRLDGSGRGCVRVGCVQTISPPRLRCSPTPARKGRENGSILQLLTCRTHSFHHGQTLGRMLADAHGHAARRADGGTNTVDVLVPVGLRSQQLQVSHIDASRVVTLVRDLVGVCIPHPDDSGTEALVHHGNVMKIVLTLLVVRTSAGGHRVVRT